MINIKQDESTDPMVFDVTIEENNGTTQHRVLMSLADYNNIFNKIHDPVTCIDAAFRFLLERESKESILSRFDIKVISNYFPEFAQEIASYLE